MIIAVISRAAYLSLSFSNSVVYHELSGEDLCKVNMHKWNAVYSSLSVCHVVGKSVSLGMPLSLCFMCHK